jgi:hypothetical protein
LGCLQSGLHIRQIAFRSLEITALGGSRSLIEGQETFRRVTGRSSFVRRRPAWTAASLATCIDDAQAVALATVDRSGVPTPSARHSIAKQSTTSKRTMTRRRHRMLAWQMQEDIDRLVAGGQVDAPGNDSPFIGQTELKAELGLNDRRYQMWPRSRWSRPSAKNAPGGYMAGTDFSTAETLPASGEITL